MPIGEVVFVGMDSLDRELDQIVKVYRISKDRAKIRNVGSLPVAAVMLSFGRDRDGYQTIAWEGIAPGSSREFDIPIDYIEDVDIGLKISYSVITPNPNFIVNTII